jgi:hypothetical protein
MDTRITLRFVWGLALLTGLPLLGCQNFNQCTSNADCAPAPDGTKLYCTPDNLCARGTPSAALCQTTYPANPPANAIIIGALVNTVAGTGNDGPRLEAFKLAIDEINPLRSPNPPLALQICEI